MALFITSVLTILSTTLHIRTDKLHSLFWLANCVLKIEPNISQITSDYLFKLKFIIMHMYTTKDM